MDKQRSWMDLAWVFIAVWILVSPWVLVHLIPDHALPASALLSFAVVGVIMMLVSILKPSEGLWHVILGIWLAASPWILTFTDNRVVTWNSALIGTLIVVLAALTWDSAPPRLRKP